MNISRPFIFRPVGTTLLVIAIALAGLLGYGLLPVSPLPAGGLSSDQRLGLAPRGQS